METRPLGKTGIAFSVVGFGTAQLQMVPERQAIDTLVRGFELGVNWVHTAPDYGGIDPWIRTAIDRSRRDVMVLSAGPAHLSDLPGYFENTCHVYGTRRLALYGLAGIEDLEWNGENVWGPGGMVEYLQQRKAEGRLGGLYCSTHGPPDYVARLVESGVFDAVMLAWNPLGFHQQSHAWARAKIGRGYEDLTEFRRRIFPLAAERGVSLLIMKPFAGGLLCKGKAIPPHDWYAGPAQAVAAADVLRLILEEPGVCAVVPGSTSIEEAEENARAGHGPLVVGQDGRERVARAAATMRKSLCSRCGACETTCSKALPIPALFRDAYIWTSRNETNQANPTENYFDLHPSPELACVTCVEQTCSCPQEIDIPAALGRIHTRMYALRAASQHPGSSANMVARTIEGRHRVIVLTSEVPPRLARRSTGVAKFLVKNVGGDRWMAAQHDRRAAVGIGVVVDDRLCQVVPLRNTICPTEVSPLAFEFAAPRDAGTHAIGFCLMPLRAKHTREATVFHSATVVVVSNGSNGGGHGLRHYFGKALRRGARILKGRLYAASVRAAPSAVVYGATPLEHSFPEQLSAGVTYGVRLTLRNDSAMTWQAHPPDGRRVDVLVFCGEPLQARLHLPHGDVAPGQSLTLHFPFRAPDEAGTHRVQVDLEHVGVTRFSDQGVKPWTIDVAVVAKPWTESVRLLEISRKHNPWHYNPLTGIPASRDGHPFPLFIARAQGARVWDAEGHEFLDYTMGWGSTILGHADERIQNSLRAMLDTGSVLPFPHPVEMEVSRMLLDEFPSNDMVVFAKNGSDVCTIASRLARVATGTKTILSCGFHGWQDFGLNYFRFEDCGIPYRDEPCLYKFRFNDLAGFLELYERTRHDLAAVMIEPAGPLLDDEHGLGGEPDPEFLATVAEATRKAKALLIFDEIITGFRYRSGSVQRDTGITPDLTCLGKALASGMPLAALLGPYRVFLEHFHKSHFNATFKSEVYSLAAARTAIQIYRTEPVVEYVWKYGEALRAAVHGVCRDLGVAAELTGPPFRMQFVFREADGHRRQLKRTLLMQELLKQRVITVTGMMLVSTAHNEETLARTVAAFEQALAVVAEADRRDDLHRHIELTLL